MAENLADAVRRIPVPARATVTAPGMATAG